MANYKGAESITMPVASATVLAQHRFVGVDSNGRLGYPASGAVVLGATLSDSPSGNDLGVPVAIRNGGVVKVECDGAVAAGARVTFEATTGKVTDTGATADNQVGLSLESGVDGQIIQVALV